MPLLTARSLAWRAQVCGEMLYSVAADGPHRDGGICKERPRCPDHVAAALAILCGRLLAAVVRQFAPSDSKLARSNLKRDAELRCSQLTQLEAALARMTVGVFQHHPLSCSYGPATGWMDTGCQPDRQPGALYPVALILPSLCACTWPQQSTRPLLGI